MAGARIDVEALAAETRALASTCEVLIVETAGGLFSPLDEDGRTNAELFRLVGTASMALVTLNRLGVLHDVEACVRAAAASGFRIDAVIANTLTGHDDESVATNVADLRQHAGARLVVPFGGGEIDDEADSMLRALIR